MKKKVASICSIILALSSLGCSHFLYYPSRAKFVNEKKLKIPPKEVFIKGKSGNKLVGWYFDAPIEKKKDTTLIFFHGNGENLSSHFLSLYWILENGYDLFIFDYPGYGISSGVPTPDSTVESGKTVIQWFQNKKSEKKMAIFSQSLGGNIALRVLGEQKLTPCLVVVESSFASYKEAARHVLKKNWFTWPIQ